MFPKFITSRFRPGGVGRHISWVMLQSLVEAGTMTIASFTAAGLFGPVAWGQLGVVLTGVQLISMIGDGFYAAVLKFVADARAKNDPASAAVGWRFGWIAIFILFFLALLLGLGSFTGYSMDLSPAWVLLAVVLATARVWRAVFDGGFRGHQEFRVPAIAGSVCSALMAGGIIAFAVAGYRIGTYMAIMAGGTLANCIWLALIYKKKLLAEAGTRTRSLSVSRKEFLKYSLPLAFRGLSAFLFLKINVWILGDLATEYDTGQFRLTDQFLTIPALLLSAVLAAITPRIAAAQMAGQAPMSMILAKIYGLMVAMTLPLALFFWWNAPLIVTIFPEFAPASRMLTFFAPAMAVQGVGYAASVLLVQGGYPGSATLLTVIPGLCNLVAAFVGFRLGGVYGLAIGTATVHFLTYAATVVVAHWQLKLPFKIRFS